MAASIEEQQIWVARLLKRIQKSGFKAAGGGTLSTPGADSTGHRVSPQESMRSSHKPSSLATMQQQHPKSATLPGNANYSIASSGGKK